jgi:hypothetical protein
MAMLRTSMMTILITIAAGAALAPAQAADCGYGRCGRDPAVWYPLPYNGVPVSFGYGLCYRQELLQTPWGPRWTLVNRCR